MCLGVRRAAGGYELPFKTLLAGREKTGSAGPLTLPLATGGLIPACLGPARIDLGITDDGRLVLAGAVIVRVVVAGGAGKDRQSSGCTPGSPVEKDSLRTTGQSPSVPYRGPSVPACGSPLRATQPGRRSSQGPA